MIAIFTDFGHDGPYLGQMHAVLLQQAPQVPYLDLMADAPSFNPLAASFLLAAYSREFPSSTVFLCVVDPGVGSERRPVVVEADGRFYVGPDNGLFSAVIEQATNVRAWTISFQPPSLSHSFHGRDLFAPVAALIARSGEVPGEPLALQALAHCEVQDGKQALIYIDHYGNCMTGLAVGDIGHTSTLIIRGHRLNYAQTFSAVEKNALFWYENSNDLIEIAANCASAAALLGVEIGEPVEIG